MTTPTPPGEPELPENIRDGDPYDNARFEELCREHDIWGTPESAMCAVFWRTAIQQAAGAVPEGWKLVPIEPTPAMIAAATVAVLPDASKEDFELAREAARIVLAHPNAPEGVSLEAIAAAMATIIPAHKAMLAASPAPPKQQPDSVHLGGGECGGVTQPMSVDWEAVGRILTTHHDLRGQFIPGTSNWGAAIWKAAHGIGKAPRPSAPTGQINPDSVAQGKEADHG